jgi:hypothetical protein
VKAGSADVTEVVTATGGVVSREEIEYQLKEHKRLEVDPGLIDQMVEDGELEPEGDGYSLPAVFEQHPPTEIKERQPEQPEEPEPEEDFSYPNRHCARCGEEFTPATKTGKICPNCDLRRQQPGPPRPEPPPPEPEPEPEPPAQPPAEPPEPALEDLAGEFAADAEFPRRRDRRARKGLGWTDEEIIERIQLYAELTGAPPTKLHLNPAKLLKAANKAAAKRQEHLDRLAFYRSGDWPSEATMRDHFGTFSAALVAAGFEARPTGRQPLGKVPTKPKPFTGDALALLWQRLEETRKEGDAEELRMALYDLGAAALTEADRIGK